ncbi:DUF1629 domain-containing protein [Bradyrhizobium sp. CSA207]|uniref:imm11 family protein n=1 Tax=Bradyrhizobium sp. CSA207 TaxID=2698826 RepID=UPI0023B011C7|nr:DUF1629 domain-containing protein [Bradyrhizobium sp. CSA207]MDE5443758.1 DUF1629 domain-containing protein [Bradyrhizobium sp. CSA207]
MKTLLESLDAEGVAFVKCEMRYPDGSAAPTYWLCDVIRLLDALDEEKSRVNITYPAPGRKEYLTLGSSSFLFKEESVGAVHIFRLRSLRQKIVCDQTVKDACKEAGMRGIGFRDASKY